VWFAPQALARTARLMSPDASRVWRRSQERRAPPRDASGRPSFQGRVPESLVPRARPAWGVRDV